MTSLGDGRSRRRLGVEPPAKSRWALAMRGVAAIIFGVLTLLLPGITLAGLILLFGSYAIVEGVFKSIVAGVVTFLRPGLTELALLYVIAVWAVVTGVLEIAAAIRLRGRIRGEVRLGLNGLLSIAFGVLTMLIPGGGALTIVWLIGGYAILFGGLLLGLSVRGWREGKARRIPRIA